MTKTVSIKQKQLQKHEKFSFKFIFVKYKKFVAIPSTNNVSSCNYSEAAIHSRPSE